jgi:phosphoribosyl-ATP pyrophosphohydrolase
MRAVSSADQPPLLPELDALLRARLAERPEGSYSVSLLTDPTLAQRKLMEEAFEVCLELQASTVDRAATAEEAADLVFHLLAALVGAGVSWSDVEAALRERHGRPARHSSYQGSDAGSGDE